MKVKAFLMSEPPRRVPVDSGRAGIRVLTLVVLLFALAAAPLLAADPYEDLAGELLAELVGIRSSAAYPQNTLALLDGVAARLRAEGFDNDQLTLVPNDQVASLVVRYPGTGRRKPLLILAHVDVVDADPASWKQAPFKLAESDGYYYGRGTLDDKDGVALALTTLIRFQREGYKPDRDLILLLTGDEETAMAGAQTVAEQHPELIDAELALNTDAGGVELDEQGRPLSAKIQVSEKFYRSYRLEATNRGGHSSLPRPDNAIYELADALRRLAVYRFPAEVSDVVRAQVDDALESADGERAELLRGVKAGDPESVRRLAERDPNFNASIRTTCVATMLEAGVAENALPRSAKATVNCRILPGVDPAAVQATLREVIANDAISVTELPAGGRPSPPSPVRDDVFSAIREIGTELWGPIPFSPTQSAGATDGLWLRRAGTPVYGFSAIGVGPDDRGPTASTSGFRSSHSARPCNSGICCSSE